MILPVSPIFLVLLIPFIPVNFFFNCVTLYYNASCLMSELISLNYNEQIPLLPETARVGILGEELACRFLVKNRCRLVVANFKVPIGRNSRGAQVTGEVDIIALDEADVLCFVEVKTRTSDQFAAPVAAVDLRKQRQIIRTARMYRKIFSLQNVKYRYDVVSIVLGTEGKPKIEHFKNFWNEDKFRKKFWADDF